MQIVIEHLIALSVFALVSSITPGPNNLMLMSSGTNFGWRRTVPHMMGVTLGFMLMLVLVGIGLIQIFDTFPLALVLLKVASICYLLFLAWRIATTSTLDDAAADNKKKSKPMTMIQAMLFQWVNPKAWAMALAAISAYGSLLHPVFGVFFVAVVFGLVNLPAVATWVVLGTQIRRLFNDPVKLKIFNVVIATLLVLSLLPFLLTTNYGD